MNYIIYNICSGVLITLPIIQFAYLVFSSNKKIENHNAKMQTYLDTYKNRMF